MGDVRTPRTDRSRSGGTPGRGLPAYRPVRSPIVSMGPSLVEERRRHRTARLVAVASVVVVAAVVLLVWLAGVLGREVVNGGRDAAAATGGTTTSARGVATPVQPVGRPDPQTLASAIVDADEPGLRMQLPINRAAVTGIGFGPRREPGVLELRPAGDRANLSWGRRTLQRFLSTTPSSDLRWYRLREGALSMVTVGAAPGTDVYAPIDGIVVAISEYVIDGEPLGEVVQLQPLGDGQTVLVLRNVDVDAELRVGNAVSEGSTQLGTVRDMGGAVAAPLSSYTHDDGSGVELYALRVEQDGAAGS